MAESKWRSRLPGLALSFLLVTVLSGCVIGRDADPENSTPTTDDLFEIVTPTVIPASTSRTNLVEYTVQEGDTLLGIALEYGVARDQLIAVNDLTDPNAIYAGQVLKIPPEGTGTPVS